MHIGMIAAQNDEKGRPRLGTDSRQKKLKNGFWAPIQWDFERRSGDSRVLFFHVESFPHSEVKRIWMQSSPCYIRTYPAQRHKVRVNTGCHQVRILPHTVRASKEVRPVHAHLLNENDVTTDARTPRAKDTEVRDQDEKLRRLTTRRA